MLQLRSTLPRYLTAGDIFLGPRSISALAVLGGLRTVVLCTPSVYSNDSLITNLKNSVGSVSLTFLCLPKGEPNLELLRPTLSKINKINPDHIIAVGGGAAMDSSKVLWLMYEIPNADLEFFQRPHSLPPLRTKAKFVAIPTTVGSGSEVSSTAVFSFGKDNIKRFIVSHELIPDIAILDSDFLLSLPIKVVVASSLDALSHALEGYISNIDNSMMDLFSETAIRTIFDDLPLLYRFWNTKKEKNKEVEKLLLNLMNAAMLAGNVQNFKVPGIGHAFAHQLARFGFSHGMSCALMLPISMKINAKDNDVREKFNFLANKLGFRNFDGLLNKVISLKNECQLANTIQELDPSKVGKINDKKSDLLADLKLDVCYKMNPRLLDDDELRLILKEVIG